MDEQMQQQIIALVQAAMQGDQQAQQQIQQIMQAAQQGDQQAMQIAQLIQAVIEQMQGGGQSVPAAKFGAQLNYIKYLRGKCPEGYEMAYYKNGGKAGCRKCAQKESMGGNMDPVKAFKCGRKMKKKACGGSVKQVDKKQVGGWLTNAQLNRQFKEDIQRVYDKSKQEELYEPKLRWGHSKYKDEYNKYSNSLNIPYDHFIRSGNSGYIFDNIRDDIKNEDFNKIYNMDENGVIYTTQPSSSTRTYLSPSEYRTPLKIKSLPTYYNEK